MSSPYPKLNDRHIDQWKVTELKEELRSRGLKLSGNKEELVRRLASALEEVADEENTDVGVDPGDDSEADKVDGGESVEAVEPTETDKVDVEHHAMEQVENSDEPVQVNVEQFSQTVENSDEPVQVNVEQSSQTVENSVETDKDDRVVNHVNDKTDQNDAIMVDNTDQEDKERQGTSFDTKNDSGTDVKLSLDEDSSDVRIEDSKPSTEDEKNGDVPESQVGIEQNSETSIEQNPETGVKNKDTMPFAEDTDNNSPDQLNQVSAEVSPDLGLQVKSESITTTTTDNVSINVKNELKDNLNANNVNLELEVVKLEMVQPSSSEVTCAMDVELCKKIEDVEEGSPEKLNLDRISSDEFMQDIVENKPIKSNNNFEKEEDAEKPIDALVSGFSPENKDLNFEEESKPIGMTEKRKAEEQAEPKSNNEPKRQRRWNAATTKVSDSQTSNLAADTPKAALLPTLRKSFNRSNSSVSGDATPKERIVPPPLKPATTLRIDRFLRPFTLKAVQELLAKTGTVSDFWMDQIKTHCYVTYSSVEEAVATRDALYNLQWPTNGGRQLVAEFVDPQEVKKHIEAPPQSPGPTTPGAQTTALPFQRQPPGPPPQSRKPATTTSGPKLPPPPPGPPPSAAKEMLPPPPPLPKEPEPPILTLDDLFRKTKTTPRIYYLPLSEEQVAAKRADHARRA